MLSREQILEFPFRENFNSSQLKGFYYDKKAKRFYIKFKNNNIYSYRDFTNEDYQNFLIDGPKSSYGKYFHQKIKSNPKYTTQKHV